VGKKRRSERAHKRFEPELRTRAQPSSQLGPLELKMNALNQMPPIADPSSIQLAMTLISALGDVKGSKARLAELAGAQEAFLSAKRAHDDSAAASAAAAANLGDLTAREGKLADRGAELDQRSLAMDVAAQAHSKRDKDLNDRERALADRERAQTAREVAFTERVATLKQQLAS
jgi:hypothetical protein